MLYSILFFKKHINSGIRTFVNFLRFFVKNVICIAFCNSFTKQKLQFEGKYINK